MKRVMAALTAVALMLSATTVFAHSGRTDGSGGHRDNKNASGLGSYHYHCGGYPAHLHTNGVCPYKTATGTGGSTTGSSTSGGSTSGGGSSGGGTAASSGASTSGGGASGTAQAQSARGSGQITLTFSFGQRTGTYVGDTQNGLPHGKGKFTTTEPSGEKWSYDGDWVNGHMHGTGLITRGAGNFEYGQYANDIRREKVKAAGDEELTDAEIDSLFTGGAHKLCGRQLSVSGRVLEIAADGQGVLVTVQLAQTGFGGGRQVDLYLSESLYGKVAVQEGQAVSVTGVYCGQRAVKSAEQEGAYVYIPQVYVNRISL